MQQDSDIRHGKHCSFRMHVHWAFVTKHRRRVFDAAAIDALRDIFQSVCRDIEARLVEMDGEDSSCLLRQRRPDIRKRYWCGVLWSPSYFAASYGGAPIAIVRQYIEQQKTSDIEPPRRRAIHLRHECRSFPRNPVRQLQRRSIDRCHS